MTKEVMQQALEAFEAIMMARDIDSATTIAKNARYGLREALKQEQGELITTSDHRLMEMPKQEQNEIERLTVALKKANEQAEHFERGCYLREDELEKLKQEQDDSFNYVQKVIEALYENSDPVSVEAAELLERIIAKQEQDKPAAWVDVKCTHQGPYEFYGKELLPVGKHNLYTKPQTKEWVGLIDEDMKDPKTSNFDFIYGARWAEQILKERNT